MIFAAEAGGGATRATWSIRSPSILPRTSLLSCICTRKDVRTCTDWAFEGERVDAALIDLRLRYARRYVRCLYMENSPSDVLQTFGESWRNTKAAGRGKCARLVKWSEGGEQEPYCHKS